MTQTRQEGSAAATRGAFTRPASRSTSTPNKHPQGPRGTFNAQRLRALLTLVGRYSHNGVMLLRWREDYQNRAGEMLLESLSCGVALAVGGSLQCSLHP
jgi:hypothetical protein